MTACIIRFVIRDIPALAAIVAWVWLAVVLMAVAS